MEAPSLRELLGTDIPGLKLRWATDSERERRVAGVIKSPTTMDSRTQRAEQGGLFCEDVFGPYEQFDETQEPPTLSSPQKPSPSNTNFGVISLPVAVVHPLWLTTFRDELAQDTGWSLSTLKAVLEGNSNYVPEQDRVVGEQQLEDDVGLYGADAVLRRLDARGASTNIILREVLVIPTGFRPLFFGGETRSPGSDLNDLYRRVVNRKNRLKRLVELDAPAIIVRTEIRMLQEGVVSLFDNRGEGFGKQITGVDRRPLVSLLDGIDRNALRQLSEAGQSPTISASPSAFENVSMNASPVERLAFGVGALPGPQLDALRRLETMGFSIVPTPD